MEQEQWISREIDNMCHKIILSTDSVFKDDSIGNNENMISCPLFAAVDTGIYPQGVMQWHIRSSSIPGIFAIDDTLAKAGRTMVRLHVDRENIQG